MLDLEEEKQGKTNVLIEKAIALAGGVKERAEKDSFYNDFFNVFGLSRRRFATFEEGVKKLDNKRGLIDLFWKGTLLIEHKSKGKDLSDAIEQAKDYLPGIKEVDLPKYILVSDFEKMILLDLDDGSRNEFYVSELYKHVKLFGFMAGYSKGNIKNKCQRTCSIYYKIYRRFKSFKILNTWKFFRWAYWLNFNTYTSRKN